MKNLFNKILFQFELFYLYIKRMILSKFNTLTDLITKQTYRIEFKMGDKILSSSLIMILITP